MFIWLETPLQIKRSAGMNRDKNDKADSYQIALYAYRFKDKAKCWQTPNENIKSLEILFSFRNRLLTSKHGLLVSSKELRKVLNKNTTAEFVYEQSVKEIASLDEQIKKVEQEMKRIIKENQTLQKNYDLITSINGISFVNAIAILVYTRNFEDFDNARCFSCYAGTAPFGKQSGTSINTAPHVSKLANKRMKSLLTQAARAAARYDPVIKAYYQRKIAEGKNKRLVINNICNKLIHRIFAVVQHKQAYQPDYQRKSIVNKMAA
ncbi:hypothetical protein FACS189456_4790 [Bacteroidia bacterium]|nr:hypothetical protein FACS189456_4790 [Bacteroidia bacterium]